MRQPYLFHQRLHFRWWRFGEATHSQRDSEIQQHPNRPNTFGTDPQQPLIELYDKIRASDPENYPAYFETNGEKVCVKIWRPDKPPEEADLT